MLELGTGSGAIAIAIASEKPMLYIKATDIKAAALKIARHNADSYEIKNIEFIKSFENDKTKFKILILI